MENRLYKLPAFQQLSGRARFRIEALLTENSKYPRWDWQHCTTEDLRRIDMAELAKWPNTGKVTVAEIADFIKNHTG